MQDRNPPPGDISASILKWRESGQEGKRDSVSSCPLMFARTRPAEHQDWRAMAIRSWWSMPVRAGLTQAHFIHDNSFDNYTIRTISRLWTLILSSFVWVSHIPVGCPLPVARTQGKRILIPQQMQEVVIVPPCFEAFPVDTAF